MAPYKTGDHYMQSIAYLAMLNKIKVYDENGHRKALINAYTVTKDKGIRTLELPGIFFKSKNGQKEYIAKIKLGIQTDTLDITGNIVKKYDVGNITKEDITRVLAKYMGKIKQEVPKYSAVHVNGKRLYEYARNNIEVELPKREVEIFDLRLVSDIKNNEFSISCIVSKGTYIRSLVRDIGISLGTCATMTELRRIKQGIFDIEQAYTLEDIEKDNYKLLDPKDILNIPKVIVDKDLEFKIKNGQVLKRFFDSDMAMILNQNNELLAIYKKKDMEYVKPFKML